MIIRRELEKKGRENSRKKDEEKCSGEVKGGSYNEKKREKDNNRTRENNKRKKGVLNTATFTSLIGDTEAGKILLNSVYSGTALNERKQWNVFGYKTKTT